MTIPRIGSQEFLEQAKMLGFNSGFEYTCWLRNTGKIITYKNAEDQRYKNKGYKDKKDYYDDIAKIKGFKMMTYSFYKRL